MKKQRSITEKMFERAKSPKDFAYSQIEHLKKRYKNLKIWQGILGTLFMTSHLVVQTLSIYLLVVIIKTYHNETIKEGWLTIIGPSVFVLSFTIILFPLTFVAVMYQSIMRAAIYKQWMQEIQYITMRYSRGIDQYSSPNKEKIYAQDVENWIKHIGIKQKAKISLTKIMRKTILGDKLD